MEIQPLASITRKLALPLPYQEGCIYDIRVFGSDFSVTFTPSTADVRDWVRDLPAREDVIVVIGVEITSEEVHAVKICVDTKCLLFQLTSPTPEFPPNLLNILNNSRNTIGSFFHNRILRKRLNALRDGLCRQKIFCLKDLARKKYQQNLGGNASMSNIAAKCLGCQNVVFPTDAGSWDAEFITDQQVLEAATFTCAASLIAKDLLADLHSQRMRMNEEPSRRLTTGALPFIPTETIEYLKFLFPWASTGFVTSALIENGDLNATVNFLIQFAQKTD